MLNWRKILLIACGVLASAICTADCNTNDVSAVDRILAASEYDAALFSAMDMLKDTTSIKTLSERARLKGVRLMAASRLGSEECKEIARKELGSYAPVHADEKLTLGEFQLGMSIEDAFAILLLRYPSVKPRLYLDGEVLCIADGNGQDLAWANTKSLEVHWLTLTPPIVRRIVGFKAGSFADLERAIERTLAVSFAADTISKGDVSQQIKTLDTVDGETLRYFSGIMICGENIRRSVRKAINQYDIDYNLASDAGIGAVIANGFEDAMQKEENERNARSPRFAPRGSLQLQLTKNAVQGDRNLTGGSRLNGLRDSASDLESLSSELEGALNLLNSLSL